MPVVVHNGIDCAAETCFCGDFVQILHDSSLVRHGNICSAHPKGTHGLNSIRKCCLVDLKCKIHVIQSQFLKSRVVHQWGSGMGRRIGKEA